MKKLNLKEKTYNDVKSSIINCEYMPGDFLNETLLSEKYGVSRTPIRDALSRLESEGFVKIISKKGVFITDISITKLIELYQVRELIEPYIIENYGVNLNKESLMNCLNYCISIMESSKLKEKAYQADADLHRILLSVNRNEYLSACLDNVYEMTHRVRILSGEKIVDRIEQSQKEHIEIVEFLLADDFKSAATSLRNHLHKSKQAALKQMIE